MSCPTNSRWRIWRCRLSTLFIAVGLLAATVAGTIDVARADQASLGHPGIAIQWTPSAEETEPSDRAEEEPGQQIPSDQLAVPPGTTAQVHLGGDALLSSGLVVDERATELPKPRAKAFLVADADSGEILAARRAHELRPMASTIKALTLLTLLSNLDPDDRVRASKEAAEIYGSRVGIVEGSVYSIRNLLEAMILRSGNDAAIALAEANGGLDVTIEQMNAQARRLNALNTRAATPHGLDTPGQYSTVYDLALIAREGLRDPQFRDLVGLATSQFPGKGKKEDRWSFQIDNQNDVVRGEYEGGLGIKSGFTTQAGRTFITAASRNGKTYIVSLLNIKGDTYKTGMEFLDWAFENGGSIEPVGTLVDADFDATQDDSAVLLASSDGEAPPEEIAVPMGERRPADGGSRGTWFLVLLIGLGTGTAAVLRRRVVLNNRR